MSKITILNEQEPLVQSADRTKAVQVWSWIEELYWPKPVIWPSQHLYLKINTGYYARKNPSEEAISVGSQITYMKQ